MQNSCADPDLIRTCIENVICKMDSCYFFCSDAFRFHIFAKMCSPLKRETHFWKPTLSNRPSKFHFLEHWRLQMITRWAIFLALMALKLFVSPLFRFSRPSEFSAQVAVLQNDIIYHTCNFVTFWWLVPLALCFWWLCTLSFAITKCHCFAILSYFHENVLPARTGSTFLKTNFERCAFKNLLLGALEP